MTPDPDEAFRWDGDEPDGPAPVLPAGWKAVGRGSEDVRTEPDRPATEPPTERATEATAEDGGEDGEADEPAGLSNAMLLVTGIIGGVYLLFAVGWIVGGMRLSPLAGLLVPAPMYTPAVWLAVAAPLLWFVAAWVLTRGKASWIRVLALVIGMVLLVPWPFVMFGLVGS
ncbi:hypothetical protein [Microbacterium resistens]|uniref:hypothetical protein n=1 Tax=Microbacterium resistens TaxID=156977 RepID=UPI00082D5B43|nr:hypothetical protein [Microbacterium resistens]